MVFAWGQRFYGKVLGHKGCYVVTRFSYFNLVPFVPRGSYLVAGERVFELPRSHPASVRAGYLRTWALVSVFAGGALTTGVLGGLPVAALGLAAFLWSWLGIGRPSQRERLEREQYARVAGIPVDVALLVEATVGPDKLEATKWLDEIRARAESALVATTPYRGEIPRLGQLVRDDDWPQISSLSDSLSPSAKAAAMVLARIARSSSTRERVRDEAAAAHDAISKHLLSAPSPP